MLLYNHIDLILGAGFADLAINGSSDFLILANSEDSAATIYNRTTLDLAEDIVTAQGKILANSMLAPASPQEEAYNDYNGDPFASDCPI